MARLVEISGSGGGGGKGGSSGKSTQSPNTLRSKATLRVVDLLGEGEIEGLVNGAKSIFFDETPLQAEDDTYNFKGVTWEERTGLPYPAQTYLNGVPAVETTIDTGQPEVKFSNPITRSLVDPNFDAVRVTIRVPSLVQIDTEKGSTYPTIVKFNIQIRYNGGIYVNRTGTVGIQGKCTSPYDRDYYFTLPKAPAGASQPWDIKVTRETADSTDDNLQNTIVFASMVGVVESKFVYPHSALMGLVVDSEQFGQNVPARAYEVQGRKVAIPNGYNASTRSYPTIWDGTFVEGWSDNPAWMLWDLLTHNRFGLGEYIDVTQVDKWSLYEIAQYCDELVESGFYDSSNNMIMEPRFTFNGVLSDAEEAYDAIQAICSAFRGMAYWSSGTVMSTQDRPADPVILVTEANVVDGNFTYMSSALNSRHTVGVVKWNDPEDNYRQTLEVYEDQDGIDRYGYRETDPIEAIGCTSRGQAHRYARWAVFSELNETQILTYQAGLDHSFIRPGDIIAVQDPGIANAEWGGRIKSISGTAVVLDHAIVFDTGKSYTISVMMPDGQVVEKAITPSVRDVATANVTLASAFSQTPVAWAVYAIASTLTLPALYKVLAVNEQEAHIYEITAMQHEPSKFGLIEQNMVFDPRPVVNVTNAPPTNLTVKESLYYANGTPKSNLLWSWSAPVGNLYPPVAYEVSVETPDGGFINVGQTKSLSLDMGDTVAGVYTIYVASVALNGSVSQPASLTYTATGWEGASGVTITGLQVKGGGTNFTSSTCTVVWTNTFPTGTIPYPVRNVIRIFDASTNALVRTETLEEGRTEYSYDITRNIQDGGPRRTFKISVTAKPISAAEGLPTQITVLNAPPAAVTPSLAQGSQLVFASWTIADELDITGAIVYASTTTGFTPGSGNQVYDGNNNYVSLNLGVGTWYVRLARYDSFGKTGLNVSGEVSITVASLGADTSTPSVPGAPTLTATTVTQTDGTIIYKVSADWADVTDSNFGNYEVELKAGAGNYISFATGQSYMEWTNLVPNTVYSVRIRSISKAGYPSAYNTVATVTTGTNATAPSAPTSLAASASFQNVYLTWTNPTNKDYDHVEIWENTTNNSGTATKIGEVKGQAFVRSALASATTKWYFLKAVNTSGQASAFTTGVSATTITAGSTDITDGAITTQKITVNTLNGDRILAGTIDALKITAGTITADRIAASGITADKILITGSTFLTTWSASADATKIDGGSIYAQSITATQIAAQTITASRLAIGFDTNLVVNGTFEEGALTPWPGSAQIFIESSTDTYMGTYRMVLDRTVTAPGTQSISTLNPAYMPVTAGDTLQVDVAVKGSGASAAGLIVRVLWYTSAKAAAASPQTDPWADSAITTSWVLLSSQITVPAGVSFARVQIFHHSTSSIRFLYVDRVLIRSALGTTAIKDGTVTTNKVAANAITAAKIGANEVTADKLGAGTINVASSIYLGGTQFDISATNRNIVITDGNGVTRLKLGKLGALATDYGLQAYDASGNLLFSTGSRITRAQLASGLSIGNFIFNSDMNRGTIGYSIGTNTSGFTPVLQRNQSTTWQLIGGNTGYVAITGTPVAATATHVLSKQSDGKDYICVAGARYEFSVYYQSSGCTLTLRLTWLDSAGAIISSTDDIVNAANLGANGQSLANYTRAGMFATAPAGAVQVRPTMIMTFPGSAANPVLYWARMYLSEAGSGQNELSAWALGIDLPNIIDASNITSFMAAATIGSAQIGTAAIQTANIGDLTVDTIKIKNGAITTMAFAEAALPQVIITARDTSKFLITVKFLSGTVTSASGSVYMAVYDITDSTTTTAALMYVEVPYFQGTDSNGSATVITQERTTLTKLITPAGVGARTIAFKFKRNLAQVPNYASTDGTSGTAQIAQLTVQEFAK